MSEPGSEPGLGPEQERDPRRLPRLAAPGRRPPTLLRIARGSYRVARRLVIGIAGVTVIAVGLLMIVTPGPAIVVIPLGLGILALEFVWARRLLRLFRVRARQAQRAYRRGDRHFWKRWLGRR